MPTTNHADASKTSANFFAKLFQVPGFDANIFVKGSSWVSGCWIWCQATSAPTKAPRRAFPLLRVLWTN